VCVARQASLLLLKTQIKRSLPSDLLLRRVLRRRQREEYAIKILPQSLLVLLLPHHDLFPLEKQWWQRSQEKGGEIEVQFW
jgi:hypothetical protein